MAKRGAGTIEGSSASKKSRRQISLSTFKQWQTRYDREFQSMSWLKRKTDPQDSAHWWMCCCALCASIRGTRNFSSTWIDGSVNHRTSSLNDHAKSDQHITAMM